MNSDTWSEITSNIDMSDSGSYADRASSSTPVFPTFEVVVRFDNVGHEAGDIVFHGETPRTPVALRPFQMEGDIRILQLKTYHHRRRPYLFEFSVIRIALSEDGMGKVLGNDKTVVLAARAAPRQPPTTELRQSSTFGTLG